MDTNAHESQAGYVCATLRKHRAGFPFYGTRFSLKNCLEQEGREEREEIELRTFPLFPAFLFNSCARASAGRLLLAVRVFSTP